MIITQPEISKKIVQKNLKFQELIQMLREAGLICEKAAKNKKMTSTE